MTSWLMRHLATAGDDPHSPAVRAGVGTRVSVVSIACNVALCLVKGAVGLGVGSVSVVADAVNNLSDASSNVVSLLGFRLARRPADAGHPYGHGRYEYLAGLVVALAVMVVGVELVQSSAQRIAEPQPVAYGWPVAAALAVSMAVKLWMARLNRTAGQLIGSETLEATAIDARNDVITTAAVLASAWVSALTGWNLDGWAGLAVGCFVVWSGFELVRDTIDPLLGQAPDPRLVAHIHDVIMSYPDVLGTHDLMVHDYGPGRKFVSAHVEMAAEQSPLSSHDTIDNIEQALTHEGLVTTLHYDPVVTDETTHDLHHWLAEQVRAIDPRITVHDVRTVPGPTHTEVIFDVVRPHDLPLDEDGLRQAIARVVESSHPDYVCKITVDEGYVSAEQ